MHNLVEFEHLQQWLKLKQPASIIRKLKKQGIGYILDANGRPATTIDCINAALGSNGDVNEKSEQVYEFA